jgi:hypothetical protein
MEHRHQLPFTPGHHSVWPTLRFKALPPVLELGKWPQVHLKTFHTDIVEAI